MAGKVLTGKDLINMDSEAYSTGLSIGEDTALPYNRCVAWNTFEECYRQVENDEDGTIWYIASVTKNSGVDNNKLLTSTDITYAIDVTTQNPVLYLEYASNGADDPDDYSAKYLTYEPIEWSVLGTTTSETLDSRVVPVNGHPPVGIRIYPRFYTSGVSVGTIELVGATITNGFGADALVDIFDNYFYVRRSTDTSGNVSFTSSGTVQLQWRVSLPGGTTVNYSQSITFGINTSWYSGQQPVIPGTIYVTDEVTRDNNTDYSGSNITAKGINTGDFSLSSVNLPNTFTEHYRSIARTGAVVPGGAYVGSDNGSDINCVSGISLGFVDFIGPYVPEIREYISNNRAIKTGFGFSGLNISNANYPSKDDDAGTNSQYIPCIRRIVTVS